MKDVMPVLIKITYCRDGQSIWLEGHFEKGPRLTDRETDLLAVLSSLCQMYSSRQGTLRHRKNTEVIRTCALAEG